MIAGMLRQKSSSVQHQDVLSGLPKVLCFCSLFAERWTRECAGELCCVQRCQWPEAV